MVFNSLTFLLFLVVVLGLYGLPISWVARKRILLVASYLFYAAWNPPYVVLLAASTAVDWWAAKAMHRSSRLPVRRALLFASLSTNLGLLGAFKYAEFLQGTAVWLFARFGVAFEPAAPDIVLPVGISFYTFQSLSYSIDVYRRETRPWHSFSDFALYVSFFPQLVAGPIVRAGELLPQLARPRRAHASQVGWGAALLVLGLFQKVVLADALLGPVVDEVYASAGRAGPLDAWIGNVAFSGQIFFDFAGYSLCALGIGSCLGFTLPRNFRCPYAAVGFRDLWQRWHITLSSWLRDYVYRSAGGNRMGDARTLANLMLTMLVSGLWHGAAWTFILWGGLNGLYLVLERWLRPGGWPVRTGPTGFAIALGTFAAWSFSWPFFRTQDLGEALHLMGAMLGLAGGETLIGSSQVATVAAVMVPVLLGQWWIRDTTLERVAARLPWWTRSAALAALVLALLLVPVENRVFIYFQF